MAVSSLSVLDNIPLGGHTVPAAAFFSPQTGEMAQGASKMMIDFAHFRAEQ